MTFLVPMTSHTITPFARYCILRGDDDFVFLYGPRDECQAIVATLDPMDVYEDDGTDSLDGVRLEC